MTIPYSWKDPIGVTTVPVNVVDRGPAVRRKAVQRIDVMMKELAHVQLALTQLKHLLLIQQSFSPDTQRAFTHSMMNARNWVLSVAISHCFIQTLFGTYQIVDDLDEMFERAAREGRSTATMDSDLRAWDNAHQ